MLSHGMCLLCQRAFFRIYNSSLLFCRLILAAIRHLIFVKKKISYYETVGDNSAVL